MGELTVVNATQESGEGSQGIGNTSLQDTGEVTKSQANENPIEQSREDNAAWKQMRQEKEFAETKAAKLERDYSIAQKYAKDYGVYSDDDIATAYGHQGITTLEQLENAIEAQNRNIDPELYNTIKTLESKVSKYEAVEKMEIQEKELANDPVKGKFFSLWKDELKSIANSFQGNLRGDLNLAYTILCEKKLPEIAQKIMAQETNQQNSLSSTGSVTGQGDTKGDFVSRDVFEVNKNDRKWVMKNLSKITTSRPKWGG